MSGQVRGWCPGALKPMLSGDGLLVRVRITGGVLRPEIADVLADAAREFGNGQIDLTSRANLQLRGVREETLQPLLARLSTYNLIDKDEASEQVRNVMASPLAGIDPKAVDIRQLTLALERRLTGDAAFHALPAKFGFAIDGGGVLSLDVSEADIGLRVVKGGKFRLTAAGVVLGTIVADKALDAALAVASDFIQLRRPDERRMRDLVKRLQDEAREPSPRSGEGTQTKSGGEGCGPLAAYYQDRVKLPAHTPPDLASRGHPPHFVERAPVPHLAGFHAFDRYSGYIAAAAPFGRIDAHQLELLAMAADFLKLSLRLSPWRVILIGSVATGDTELLEQIGQLGFVIDPADPRLAIAACPGSPSCLSGEAPAQVDAAMLAPVLAPFIEAGASVHVSGCAKGCARRLPASITLVGQGGRYGLAFDADSKASSQTPPMDIDEIAAFLTKNLAQKSFKSREEFENNDHV